MLAACRYTRLKVHGKAHKYYGTSPIVFGSDGVDTVCNNGAGHFAHRSQILGGIRNTRTRSWQHQALHVLVFCCVVLPSFHINIKYTIRMMPKDILFLMSCMIPLSFSSRLMVVLPCSLTIMICEECDVHFFFIQKRVHNIAWTWCHFLHVRSMAWTGRMLQMKMQIFLRTSTKKQAKNLF